MFHLVMTVRPHRVLAPRANPVKHEWPVGTVEEAVALCKEKMRDNYADPFELQNEDRTQSMDEAALKAAIAASGRQPSIGTPSFVPVPKGEE